ncbi:MAG: hypothetical protein KUL86_03755 [Castellaniella sp.]|nr:hypothetical protein [Castellaniella sp.]
MRTGTSTHLKAASRCGVLVAALVSSTASVAVASPDWDPARALGGAHWTWGATQSFELPGARVSLRRFRAALPPGEAARRLAVAGGRRLLRLQWSGTTLLLSGGEAGQHWLAQLRPAARGTDGLVSSLVPQTPTSSRFDPVRFVPAGSRPVLSVATRGEPVSAMLTTFDCHGTLGRVAAVVRRNLLADQWLPADAVSSNVAFPVSGQDPSSESARESGTGFPVQWRHRRHGLLSVHLVPRLASVGVTFWHRPKESP